MRPSSAMFMIDSKGKALWFTSASTRPNNFGRWSFFSVCNHDSIHNMTNRPCIFQIPQIPKKCDELNSGQSTIIYLFNTSFHHFKRSTLRPLPQIGGHSLQHRTATKRLASLHVPGLPGLPATDAQPLGVRNDAPVKYMYSKYRWIYDVCPYIPSFLLHESGFAPVI